MKRAINSTTLTGTAFASALSAIGWKQTDFARRTGVTPATVNAWVNDRAPAPPWATAYLEAMLDLAALHRKYLAPLPPVKPPADQDAAVGQAPAPRRLAHLLPDTPHPTE